ncbi:uncharacterized protein PV09_03621 [Verruconis gallopava]|uniref:DUF1917 domain-containing protein n=1 Tax=Verruconis gallopava TaxID=253628 RepID=A0A0D2AGQ5_9PEZI|nr:uncharacterized protein PV09_03621 [Verruconis gallopava]KIW05765.1 hypothetical protein PV09_03621 [Verruconis gallopava]
MSDAYFSDDSSFYGDASYVEALEEKVENLDIEQYWDSHGRDLNVIFGPASQEDQPDIPDGSLHNRYEGEECAWQLHETVDDFVTRLPVLGSTRVGPWIWVANPYAEREASEPEHRHALFMQRAPRLLSAYLDEKQHLFNANPAAAPATITRRLKPARDKLKDDILTMAKETGMTSGKWMLFPAEEDASAMWKRVVEGVVKGKLGTAAKIATDGSTRLICVYTKDFNDEEDVKRVLQSMEKMDLLQKHERGIYYKCDAYTYLDIGSGNEYGLQASLYSSKDMLAGKTTPKSSTKREENLRKTASVGAGAKAAGKKKKT